MNMAISAVPNFEEAANVASEFITSLDNLPNEVQHLLQEIKSKEQRCQELHHDIAKDQSRYIKSSLKHTSSAQTPPAGSNGQNKSGTASPTPTPNGSNSKAHLPARIAAAYAEIDTLTNDKICLAHRIIELLSRTRARLDSDLSKVRLLQGESPEDIRNSSLGSLNQLPLSSPYSGKRPDIILTGISPVVQVGESLRSVVGVAQQDSAPPSATPSAPAYKKRRLTTNTSIKLPSPAPSAVVHQSIGSHPRSRLSRQSHSRVQQEEEDLDADAEGDEDVEGEDAEEDLTLYCFCHKQSYGDMIGCDNPDCPYQWFHISCVGVKQPLPDKWYCPDCIKHKSVAAERRKGRKK